MSGVVLIFAWPIPVALATLWLLSLSVRKLAHSALPTWLGFAMHALITLSIYVAWYHYGALGEESDLAIKLGFLAAPGFILSLFAVPYSLRS